MMGYGVGGAGMWLFGLLTLVGVGLLGLLAVRLLGGGLARALPTPGATAELRAEARAHDLAKAILDERYARGEIDTEEYQDRIRGLSTGRR